MKIVKTVPFNLELAKKVVNKEIEGEIVTEYNQPVRIICFDKKTTSGYPIVGLVHYLADQTEVVYTYTNGGKARSDKNVNLQIKLFEEVEEHEYIYYFSQQPSKLLHSEEINKIAKKIIVDGNIIKNRDRNEGPANLGWRSCKQRMPKLGEKVLFKGYDNVQVITPVVLSVVEKTIKEKGDRFYFLVEENELSNS